MTKKTAKPPTQALAPVSHQLTNPTHAAIRQLANTTWVTSIARLEMAALHAQEPFNQVTMDQLMHWRKADQWEQQRRDFHAQVRKDLLSRRGREVVELFDGLAKKIDPVLERVEEALGQMVFSKEEPAKLINAFVKLAEFRASLARDSVQVVTAPEVAPDGTPASDSGNQGGSITIPMNAAEAKLAAHAIMMSRQQKDVVDVTPKDVTEKSKTTKPVVKKKPPPKKA